MRAAISLFTVLLVAAPGLPALSKVELTPDEAVDQALSAIRGEEAVISIQGRALTDQEKRRLKALAQAETLVRQAQKELSASRSSGSK